MINNIASSGVHAADLATLRPNRAKKTEPAQNAAVETGKTQKPAHPAHPHGHIPPGLARAAERIASKIFARADADANGTVTQQELSALHSKHARTLASSDLFQTTTPQTTSTETPTDATTEPAPVTTIETTAETTGATSEPATDPATETATETPTQIGVTEAQLKEALTKFFYAKVGVTYTTPTSPVASVTEPPAPTAPPTTTTPSVVDFISEESASNPSFIAVA
jgi:hypothetical protein